MFKIVLAGRPNVGKTTLFNKLCQKNLGIVYNTPGVTRDRQEGLIKIWDIDATLIDIAGIENIKPSHSSLKKSIYNQAIKGIEESNLIFFMLDGKDGILNEDIELFNKIRKFDKNVIVLVNKIESEYKIDTEELNKFSKHFAYISSEHNLGFDGLLHVLRYFYDKYLEENNITAVDSQHDKALKIAFVGRPNAGKSTIINKILQDERMITDDVAGTTRDSIYIDFKFKDQKITLIDTAGVRRKANITDAIEQKSVDDSFSSIDLANVCVLVMDVENALESQDINLIQKIINEGRILILLFNKIDKIKSSDFTEKELIVEIKKNIMHKISELPDVIFFTTSALHENNFELLFKSAIELYEKWNSKIKTKLLNDFILEIKSNLKKIDNKPLKLKYISQVKSKPPLFVIYSNKEEKNIPESQIRYIRSHLKSYFNLEGITIRLNFKKKE